MHSQKIIVWGILIITAATIALVANWRQREERSRVRAETAKLELMLVEMGPRFSSVGVHETTQPMVRLIGQVKTGPDFDALFLRLAGAFGNAEAQRLISQVAIDGPQAETREVRSGP